MADIDIERKKSGSIWPWLLGLLALALLVWLLMSLLGDDEEEVPVAEPVEAVGVAPVPAAPVAPPVANAGAVPPVITSYLVQCTQQGGPGGDMGAQHAYTVTCLRQLREGIQTLVTQEQVANTDVSARFDQFNSTVQQLEASNAESAEHANLTRNAATTATEVMQAMQTAWFGTTQPVQQAVQEVQTAAQGIQPTVPMLDQRDSVQGFFREAGEALEAMAQNRPAAAAM